MAAYRLPFLLAGDSVILKSPSEYYEYFYSYLKPGIHYIPFSLSNITRLLEDSEQYGFNQVCPAYCSDCMLEYKSCERVLELLNAVIELKKIRLNSSAQQ